MQPNVFNGRGNKEEFGVNISRGDLYERTWDDIRFMSWTAV